MRVSLRLAVLLALVCPGLGQANEELALHEKTLKDAGLAVDGPSLLKYVKSKTLDDKERQRIATLIKELGHRSFKVRNKAYEILVLIGRNARRALEDALEDEDPQIRKSAERAIEEIDSKPFTPIMAAALRVLAARNPEGTLDVLIGYMPMLDDENVSEAMKEALATAGVVKGKPDARILTALQARDARLRGFAAHAVGKASPVPVKELVPLLRDSSGRVRFEAAFSLLRGGDQASVPALIALLDDNNKSLASEAEDLLYRVAGEGGPQTGGKDLRQAWDKWWKDNQTKVNLAKLNLEETLRGLTVVAELDGSGATGQGRVVEFRRDGTVRFEYSKDVIRPSDAWILPNGNFLVAEHSGSRVTERDRDGKIIWQHNCNDSPVSCQRLPNGNTMIATYNMVMEVDRSGKRVFEQRRPSMVFGAQKLRDGHLVIAQSDGKVIELDSTGKEIVSVNVGNLSGWASVERLPNRRYLVSGYSGNFVKEVDANGKVYWEISVNLPGYATRLPSGNTLVCSIGSNFVAEYDRNGKQVWHIKTAGRPFRVHRR